MAIKKYTNFEAVNAKTENEGKYLQLDDQFIVTKNEIQETDFGECKYDVMEVSVYDINNNLLPHKTGNNVAYIKTGDIKNYMYNITNKGGNKELAIDIEKLLNDLGFTNGILKVNINFVRYRVGTENESTRVWIQQISPSREEIRILPLKTKDDNINKITKKEFTNINNLSKDFKYYKKNILDSLDDFEMKSLSTIDDVMVRKFGNDFINILRKDFGLRDFGTFRTRIFENFRESIKHWLNNRYYDVSDSTFGKPSEIRFIDCDQYYFESLLDDMKNILNNCISFNIKTLNRRSVQYNVVPKEFSVVELRKNIKNTLESFDTFVEKKKTVFRPDKYDLKPKVRGVEPIIQEPPITISPIEITLPIKEEPILIKPTPEPIMIQPAPEPITAVEPISTPSSGGGGGGSIYREYDTLDRQNLADGGMGRERMEFT
jgi:hypothetical protein